MSESTSSVHDALLERARSAAHLAAEQSEIVAILEQQTADPDLLFQLFRARHLLARTRVEIDLLQVMANLNPGITPESAQSVSVVARNALEGAVDYQNVRLTVDSDFALVPEAVPALTLALTQVLDIATANERFGRVHMRVGLDSGAPRFDVTDYGGARGDIQVDEIVARIERGINSGEGEPCPEDSFWLLGATLSRLPFEINLQINADGKGNTVSVIVSEGALSDLDEVQTTSPGAQFDPAKYPVAGAGTTAVSTPLAQTPPTPSVPAVVAASTPAPSRLGAAPVQAAPNPTVSAPVPEDPPLFKALLAKIGIRNAFDAADEPSENSEHPDEEIATVTPMRIAR